MFTRSEAVTALRLMVGSSGRDPMQFALHSGRIGGGTIKASRTCKSNEQENKWKSRAFMTIVREAGEGADAVSAVLAQSVEYRDQAGLMV